MGISGLLPLLKSIQRPRHIREWAGKTIGVDAYGWLHKGTISCAIDLALGRPTTKYVDYVMHRVKMLQHFGVTPYLVFDGDYLPSKAGTEAAREKKRAQYKVAGLELLELGRSSQAHLTLQKAIDVTPTMARHIIDTCTAIGVQCLVAPYEADSQLYYLEKTGIIDAVVSEDSDLLVFGVKCLITKLDQFGECVEVNRDHFTACKEVSLAGWTQTEFRHMCILSGCDYLENIPSMGLKTAYRLMRRYKDVEKVLRAVRFEGKMTVPNGYLEAFKRADMTFQHQRVFCPIQDQMVMANDPEPHVTIGDDILVYIGPEVEADTARRVARGELDPITKEPIKVIQATPKPHPFARKRAPTGQGKPLEMPPKNKTITSFFKPTPETRPAVAKTPLRPKDTNRLALMDSYSALAQISSAPISKKRPLHTSTASENKKPRIAPPTGHSDSTLATAERSSFFKAQSRRPICAPTPISAKENVPPIKTPRSKIKKTVYESPPLPPSSSPPQQAETVSHPSTDPAKKVTQGWKELFGFSQASRGKTLSEIIEKQRQGSSPLQMTSLQHLRAKTLDTQRRAVISRTSSMPLTRPTQSFESSSSEESQDLWPEFVSSNGSATSSQSDSQADLLGAARNQSQGMFDGFAFSRR